MKTPPLGMTEFKASETLLGIETAPYISASVVHSEFKASETLLGIETKALRIG